MRRCVLVVVGVVAWVSVAVASDWRMQYREVTQSVVPLVCEIHQAIGCTAFSIDSANGFYATAAHCLTIESGEAMWLDGAPLRVVFKDERLDYAVLRSDVRRPALKRASVQPGQEVAAFGFGQGYPMFRVFTVSTPELADKDGRWFGMDKAVVGGMSGGPIIDRSGRVVGVVQLSDVFTGWSRTIQSLYATAPIYWER